MSAPTLERPATTRRPAPTRQGLQPRPSKRAGDLSAIVAGIGGGLVLAMSAPVIVTGLGTPGGIANGLGILTAMVGTYLALLGCVLMARLPWIEREVGQDRLTHWHRKLGPYALVLITLHVILTTVGYAQATQTGLVSEFLSISFGMAWMLPALVAFVLMVGLGVISWRRIRSRMKYETWLTAHQYFYLAVALAFGHQIEAGSVFMGHELAKNAWIALYVLVAAAILTWRVAVPAWRSIRHGARVEAVVPVDADTAHVYVTGRNFDRLKAQGGQWFTWRFGTRAWWWQGHPYSLSAAPTDTGMRITLKNLGDQSGSVTSLKPGTRVLLEGPYGAFRADRRHGDEVVLIGAGIGITPIRALLEELPQHVRATVIYRIHAEPAPLVDELRRMEEQSNGRIRLFVVAGSRHEYPLNARQLIQAAPGIARSDVYLCGPMPFIDAVTASARELGVPSARIHSELFEF